MALACLLGIPIGVGTGLFLAEYGGGRLGWLVRFVADVMNGTPSIVVGIFAWTWLVRPVGHFSALAGGAALAILMIPMLARTTEEMVRLVPNSLREAALALGYPRWRTSLAVVARTALGGIVTGGLVAVARIAGETAPLLFTALGNLNFSTTVTEPMQTLSLQILRLRHGPLRGMASPGLGRRPRPHGNGAAALPRGPLGHAATSWRSIAPWPASPAPP